MFDSDILALDISAARLGWAFGSPGARPASGSIVLKHEGSSHEAIGARAFDWYVDFLKVSPPKLVVWEAPVAPSFNVGKTNIDTFTILFGLPFLIGAVTYKRGIYDIRKAAVSAVRCYFIGKNYKGEIAKPMTVARCNELGWAPSDHDAADALAVWAYQVKLLRPDVAPPAFKEARKK